MILRRAFVVAILLPLASGSVPVARAQGVIAETTNDRTQTFLPSGTPGPVIDSTLLRGRPARPEGPFGLLRVDTPVGPFLVKRSAVMFAGGQALPSKCERMSNLTPNTRNYGSNGFGTGCPASQK